MNTLILLESGDVAKELDLVPQTIRLLTNSGALPLAARTPRGTRLFKIEDVMALKFKRMGKGK